MMPLVATNIQQSFRWLSSVGADFHHDFQRIADSDPSYEKPFVVHGFTFRPVLYRRGTDYSAAQVHYLGFYALQQAVRGLMLGVNHCIGGNVSLAEELYGPAVASYYTAAYHALHGFLALSGRSRIRTVAAPDRD